MKEWLKELPWIVMPSFAALVTLFIGYFILGFNIMIVFNVTAVAGFATWAAIIINEINNYLVGLKKLRGSNK